MPFEFTLRPCDIQENIYFHGVWCVQSILLHNQNIHTYMFVYMCAYMCICIMYLSFECFPNSSLENVFSWIFCGVTNSGEQRVFFKRFALICRHFWNFEKCCRYWMAFASKNESFSPNFETFYPDHWNLLFNPLR